MLMVQAAGRDRGWSHTGLKAQQQVPGNGKEERGDSRYTVRYTTTGLGHNNPPPRQEH